MKLIRHTYRYSIRWILAILVLGSVFCFSMIEYINHEEADEFLQYEMDRLIAYHEANGDLPEFHKVAAMLPDVAQPMPVFSDTMILEPGDNEMVPYRQLHFSITHKGRPFTIVLRHLLPGKDDILEGTALIIGGLMLLIGLAFYLIANYLDKKLWKPFYQTLQRLMRFQLTDPLPALPQTSVDEFSQLNTTVSSLLAKIKDDYQLTREFNENASHELQTQLAIIRANAEQLINAPAMQDEHGVALQHIYAASIRLSQAQKSLLLLSKISNQEYKDERQLDVREVVQRLLETYTDSIAILDLHVTLSLEASPVFIDIGLADILINNILKNAIKHNVEGGTLNINLSNGILQVENTGPSVTGDPSRFFGRFAKGNEGNMGIGLAIVKQICDLYHFNIDYTVAGNVHAIKIRFAT